MLRGFPSRKILVLLLSLVLLAPLFSVIRPAQAQGSRQLQAGLIAYWNFNEGTGTTAHDSSGNGNDGSIIGASWTTGINGSALDFDGTSNYVKIPNSASLNIIGTFTIEAWIKPTDWNNDIESIYSHGTTYNDATGINFERRSTTGGMALWIGDGSDYQWSATASDPPLGQWSDVVGTFDNSTIRMYVNGQPSGTPTPQSAPASYTGDARIGINPADPATSMERYFKGAIDEVRIYNRALNGSEVKSHYQMYVPDLSIKSSDINFSPASPVLAGTQVTISAIIHNLGNGTANTATVKFYQGDPNASGSKQLGTNTIKNLAGGGSFVVTLDWLAVNVGKYDIYIVISGCDPVEIVLSNNIAFNTIIVATGPDLTVKPQEIYFSNGSPQEGSTVDISAIVWNLGDYGADNIVVRFMDGTADLGDRTIATLLAGDHSIQTLPWIATPAGQHKIVVTVDPDNQILETNETNNMASRLINVSKAAPSGKPDLEVSPQDISFSTINPTQGSILKVSAIIHNLGTKNASSVIVRMNDGQTPIGADINIGSLEDNGGLALVHGSWNASSFGPHNITVSVDPDNLIAETNETNNIAMRSVTVTMPTSPSNHSLRFVSSPLLNATVGLPYVYDSHAIDDNGDAFAYDTVIPPTGLTIEAPTGRVSWTPSVGQEGDHIVLLRAMDGTGGIAEQQYILHVVLKVPRCTITYPTQNLVLKGPVTIKGTSVKGALDVKTVSVRIDGGSWTTANGTGNWTSTLDTTGLANGPHLLEAKASDNIMESTMVSVHFKVSKNLPPKKYNTYLTVCPWWVLAVVLASVVLVITYRYRNKKS